METKIGIQVRRNRTWNGFISIFSMNRNSINVAEPKQTNTEQFPGTSAKGPANVNIMRQLQQTFTDQVHRIK